MEVAEEDDENQLDAYAHEYEDNFEGRSSKRNTSIGRSDRSTGIIYFHASMNYLLPDMCFSAQPFREGFLQSCYSHPLCLLELQSFTECFPSLQAQERYAKHPVTQSYHARSERYVLMF